MKPSNASLLLTLQASSRTMKLKQIVRKGGIRKEVKRGEVAVEWTGPEGERRGMNEGKRLEGKGPDSTLEILWFLGTRYDLGTLDGRKDARFKNGHALVETRVLKTLACLKMPEASLSIGQGLKSAERKVQRKIWKLPKCFFDCGFLS